MKHYFTGRRFLRSAALTLLLSGSALQAQIVQTFSYTGSLQTFTVPTTCVNQVTIDCRGAQGGGNGSGGGRGARMVGVYTVTPGMVLNVVVGQMGQLQSGGQTQNSSGGGGGSFVWTTGPTLLVAAGGGGGLCNYSGSVPPTALNNGTVSTAGNPGDGPAWSGTNGVNGINGNGGTGGQLNSNFDSGGGAGWLNNSGGPHDGGSFPNFAGGTGYCGGGGGGCGGVGGYGGGGGGGNDYGGGGGGGGYSGGGGGTDPTHGGGGGSFSSGTNQSNTSGYQDGNGLVVISYNTNGNGVMASAINANICPGGSTSLNASNVLTYTWSPGGSNAQSIQVSPASTTTYVVQGTNVQGCISTAVLVVTVNPTPMINVVSSKSLICVGDTALLTASGAGTYQWTNGPATNTFVISPSSNTNSTYTVVGTSTAGCPATVYYTSNVNPNLLSTSGNTAICLGRNAQLSAGGAVGPYSWTDTNSGLTTPFQSTAVSPSVTTNYVAAGVDANGCTLTQTITVVVNSNPTVAVVASPSVICKGNTATLSASGASSYSWSTGGNTQVITVSPLINTTYNYTVTGTDGNGCTNSKVTAVRVELCTGIAENNGFQAGVTIYPNPGTGLYRLRVEEKGNTALKLNIYNASGALVKVLSVEEQDQQIDLRAEAAGIYFFQLTDGSHNGEAVKIVKE